MGKAGSAAGISGAKAGQGMGKSAQSASGKSKTTAGKPLLGKNGKPVGACCAGHSKEKK